VSKKQRLRAEIHGAVQGVGFRPFVYRLATEHALSGWVINDTRGVFIEVEGPQAELARFLERLPVEKPPRAIIHSLESAWLEPIGYEHFEIRHSDDQGAKTVLVLPDIAGPHRSPSPLPLHQLHQLWPPLHHHPSPTLRPAQHHHAPVYSVPKVPGRV
jgi:acylphosphatase